jgi:hypothetical protein
MDDTNAFQWPTDPPQDWFEAKGAALGLTPETIRFAAALHSLGGADSKKNTQAARIAGVAWDRVQAFRAARSVGVRALLDEAKRLKAGKLPPLTEEDIDREIDDLIRQPDALTKARGIELREKRKDRLKERGGADDYDRGDGLLGWRVERDWLLMPNGAAAYALVHGLANCHLLHDSYSLLMQQEFGPEIWSRLYPRLSDGSRAELDRHLSDPSYQADVRKQIWGEVGIDITKVDRPKHLRAGMNGHDRR